MTVAISKAVDEGAKAVICASTGNTSASAAAYAARAGLRCAVVIPEGQIAMGKLAQALIHGATVVPIRGNFDAALDIVRQLGASGKVAVVNSVNPYRIEGQKTAAFEIVDVLGDAPARALHPGRQRGQHHRVLARLPRGLGSRAVDPARPGCSAGRRRARHRSCAASRCCTPRRSPPRSRSATRRAGTARSAHATSRAARSLPSATPTSSTRTGCSPTARASSCEPASAASVAGLLQAIDADLIAEGDTVVCTLTGHGLKDPQRAISEVVVDQTVDADAAAVAGADRL